MIENKNHFCWALLIFKAIRAKLVELIDWGLKTMSDKFYITLTEEDQMRLKECLSTGTFDNAGDLIREGIQLSYRRAEYIKDQNWKLRAGLSSISERLARYKVS